VQPTYGTPSSAVVQPSAEGCIFASNINLFDINMAGSEGRVGHQSTFQTGCSGIFTRPSSVQNKENQDPCDSPKWLHRNDNYVRTRHQVYGDNYVLIICATYMLLLRLFPSRTAHHRSLNRRYIRMTTRRWVASLSLITSSTASLAKVVAARRILTCSSWSSFHIWRKKHKYLISFPAVS